MSKTYKIYRLENFNTEDMQYLYCLPETGVDCQIRVSRATKRMLELADFKRKGYVVTGVIRTDKEEYLNHRLNQYVKDYIELDRKETQIRVSRYLYTPEVAYDTLEMIQDSKRTAVKQISSVVRRLHKDGLLVHSEMAMMIYDMHIKTLF